MEFGDKHIPLLEGHSPAQQIGQVISYEGHTLHYRLNRKGEEMKKYVLGLMFSADRTFVALIRKKKPEWQKDKLNGIGGKIEDGELAHHAMPREFYEETGVRTNHRDWSYMGLMKSQPEAEHPFEVRIYKAFTDNVFELETQAPEEGEVSVYDVRALMDAPHQMLHNVPALIQLALTRTVVQLTDYDSPQ